jgi:hypothetical protein
LAMGLGKTIVVITILVHLLKHRKLYNLDWRLRPEFTFRPDEDLQAGFLFVVPRDLITLWEIERKCRVNLDAKPCPSVVRGTTHEVRQICWETNPGSDPTRIRNCRRARLT